MIRLYVLDLQQISPKQWPDLLPTLPEDRQRRVLACRQEPDRVRTAGAGWLLQFALSGAGISVPAQRFTKNSWGKPQLEGRDDIHFSLSHSGRWVVCALSDAPVGVDVEKPRCTEAVAWGFFRPDELTALDPVFLTRLWTAKEAFAKALGRGLTIPLDSFAVRLNADCPVLEQSYTPLPYRLHEYRLGDDLLCLCSLGNSPEPTFVTI